MLSPELHAFNNYMLCLLLTKLPSLKLPVYENVVRERLPISFAAPYACCDVMIVLQFACSREN